MQFVVLGIDGTDEEAMSRRLASRQAHIEMGNEVTASGNMWYGAALLNDAGRMKGSMLLMDFPSEEALQGCPKREPYVTGGVWKNVEIHKANVRDPWQFNRPKEFFDVKA